MAKKEDIVKFKATCKANKEHKNEFDSCPNCGKKKLHLMFNEDGKIRTVSCKNCHHSFDKIKCQHGPAQIYWQDFTTKGIEEEKKKKKDKKEWKDFWDFVALVFLTILVVWLFLIALGG